MKKLFYLPHTFILFLIISCGSKDTVPPSSDLYIASPEKIVAMAGKDWNAVKPDLEGKKGYWYSEFPQDQNAAVKAAVSLDAVEEDQTNVHYHLQINVDRQTNRVTVASVATVDSLTTLNQSEANALLLKYYQRGMLPMTDTVRTSGNYISQQYNVQVTSTVADVLNKMSTGFSSDLYTIDYYTNPGMYTGLSNKDDTYSCYFFYFEANK